ncbi:MAG: histone [Aliarcobacter sp.]
MVDLPYAPVKRVAMKNGAERVGDEATKRLTEVAEEYIGKVAQEAAKLAQHAGRKTLKPEDIELAVRGL